MDVRMHYLRLLRASFRRNPGTLPTHRAIGLTLADWMLFREYWDESDSMEALASRIGVTREELASFIRSRLGGRFLTLRKRLRVHDAGELLVHAPGMTLAEIVRTVGFQDKSDFRKAFVEEKGMSPRSWRECRGNRLRYWIRRILGQDRNHCP